MARAKAKPKPKPEPQHTGLYLMALGLLVGLVGGFVVLLSKLPVDGSMGDYKTARGLTSTQKPNNDYEFYTVLTDEQTQRSAATNPINVEQTIIRPATRSVPANAQNMNTQNLAAQSYAEIPASSIGQESYYLQAGSFVNPSDAEQQRAVVLMLGLEAFVVERTDADGNNGHRVRIGPFFDNQRLTEAKKRLRRGSVKYDIVRVTG